MNGENFVEDFFYIKASYLKRILSLYSILIIILFLIFVFSNEREEIPTIAIFMINLISSFIFIGYSGINISSETFKCIKIHLIFLIALTFIGIVKIDIPFLSQILMFDCNENINIVENIYIFSTIPMCLLLLCTKGKYLAENVLVKYFITIIVLLLLIYSNNINMENHSFLYMIFYIVDFVLLFLNCLLLKKFKIKKKNHINIYKIIIIILLFLDLISILYLKEKRLISIISIIKFICLNIVLSNFINNMVRISNSVLFKDMYNVNNNLKIINEYISDRNIKLQNTREELASANRIYRDFIQMVNIPIVIVNINSKRINFCNNEFIKITRNDNIKKIINKKFDKFINFQGGDKVLKDLSNDQIVLGYVENNNEVRLFEINFVKLNERNEELLLLFDDITEKKNIERVKIELEKIQKNEKIKSNFLSTISHDLKTPIGIIDSAVQLQKVFLEKNDLEVVKKYNQICKENCIYLTRLTNNLIDISRISEQLLKPVFNIENIVSFIEGRVEIISEYANFNKIKIIFDTNEEDIFVRYDKELMERIILNLLSNSIKYTSEGGLIQVNITGTSSEVKIEFCDSGRGMTEEFIKEAFNIYTMENGNDTKKNKSNGIGLFVVYNLIEIQEGKISIESEVGKGSKFIVTFKREQVYGPIY